MDDFKNEYEESQNIIVERNKAVEDTLYDEDKVEVTNDEIVVSPNKKNKKPKNKFSFKKLTKKQKIIFIVSISLILIAIVFVILYFAVLKPKKAPKKDNTPSVVIEKDNYIYNDGTLTFLSKDDKKLGNYECENKDEEKCFVANYANENNTDLPKYLDENEEVLNRRSQIYNDNYVFVQDGEVIYLYDISKKEKIGEYKLIKIGETQKKVVAYKDKDDKYGLLDLTNENKNLTNTLYDYIDIYKIDNAFIAKNNNESFLINSNGDTISKKMNCEIKSFSDKYIFCGEYLYDYNLNKVLPDSYDYININSDYIFALNGKKMIVFDSKLNKLNEDPYKIKTNDYYTKYIFDKDNNLKNTKKAFEYSVNGSTLTIKYEDITKNINVNEGVINNKYDYVSYFDGILYFYLDEDKTNLIGSYTCKNKNNVTSENDEYKNCFVANETNIINETKGYLPIFNSSYVFINDTKDGKNIINLYDLKNGKIVSEYNQVDTGLASEKITHATSLNSLIVCQNTQNGYGVITFGASGPSGLIAFNDNKNDDNSTGKTIKISILKDYLYVQREKANLLYDKIGNEIARSKFEITDYHANYILVKDNDKYLVYLKGVIISKEGKFIKLYDNYFVLIDNDNKLNIYSYTDGKKELLENSLTINNKSLESSYEINETDSNYIITIVSNDNTKVEHKFNKNNGKEIIGDDNEG